MKRIYEILLVTAAFLLICFVYHGQQRTKLIEGWDASYYYKMADQIHQGIKPVTGELPFVKRIGMPTLIAHFSNFIGKDLLDSALYVNLIGTWLTTILLLLWLSNYFEKFWIRGLLCFLFMMAWHVPLRFLFYNPMSSDAWGAAWMMAALLALQAVRKSYLRPGHKAWIGYLLLFSVCLAIGSLFRESNALLCILPIFLIYPVGEIRLRSAASPVARLTNLFRKGINLVFSWKTILLLVPMVFVALAGIYVKKQIQITGSEKYEYLWTAITWVYTKSLPEFLLGILIAYGPLILLLPLFFPRYKSLLWERQELLILLALSVLLGLIGGTDTERILFMSGFPVVLLLIGICIQNLVASPQRWWFYVLLMAQSISFRFFWLLPDYSATDSRPPIPFFGLLGSHFKYLNLYSRFSNYYLNTILLIQFLLLFLATAYVIRNKIVLKPGTRGR